MTSTQAVSGDGGMAPIASANATSGGTRWHPGGTPAGTDVTAGTRLTRLDRRIWLAGGALVGLGALLAVGVSAWALAPFVIIGACLGMHLFMGHGGHGGHGEHTGQAAPSADRPGGQER